MCFREALDLSAVILWKLENLMRKIKNDVYML